MVNYKNGKIYKLYCKEDPSIFNIGSTAQLKLSRRMIQHKSSYTSYKKGKCEYMTSFKVFEAGTAIIELIEDYPCDSLKELRAREGYWLRQFPECVNRKIEGRTRKQWYEDNKDRLLLNAKINREKHIDKFKQRVKKNRENKRELILEKERQYREKNKDRIKASYEKNKHKYKESRKKYYDNNKEKILLQAKQCYIKNRELKIEKQRQYRKDNIEKIKEKQRQRYRESTEYARKYYKLHRDEILRKKKERKMKLKKEKLQNTEL